MKKWRKPSRLAIDRSIDRPERVPPVSASLRLLFPHRVDSFFEVSRRRRLATTLFISQRTMNALSSKIVFFVLGHQHLRPATPARSNPMVTSAGICRRRRSLFSIASATELIMFVSTICLWIDKVGAALYEPPDNQVLLGAWIDSSGREYLSPSLFSALAISRASRTCNRWFGQLPLGWVGITVHSNDKVIIVLTERFHCSILRHAHNIQ